MSFQEYPLITGEGGIPFLICGIGSHDAQPSVKRLDGFSIDLVLYVLEGRGILNYNGVISTLQKNDLVLLRANIPYEYHPVEEPWTVKWVTFTGEHMNDYLDKLGFDKTHLVPLHNPEAINIIFDKIASMLRSKQKNKVYRCSPLIYELILEIFYQMNDSGDTQLELEDTYLSQAISFINQNFHCQITLEEIAATAHISPEYLCILFRRHLQMRPFEYLSKKRIQKAKHLLSDTSMSIADIGSAVGYDSNSYFGYVFKKYEQMSPSQFRGFIR